MKLVIMKVNNKKLYIQQNGIIIVIILLNLHVGIIIIGVIIGTIIGVIIGKVMIILHNGMNGKVVGVKILLINMI